MKVAPRQFNARIYESSASLSSASFTMESWSYALGFLEASELLPCALVCRTWRKLVAEAYGLHRYRALKSFFHFFNRQPAPSHRLREPATLWERQAFLLLLEKNLFRQVLISSSTKCGDPLLLNQRSSHPELQRLAHLLQELHFIHTQGPFLKKCHHICFVERDADFQDMRPLLEQLPVISSAVQSVVEFGGGSFLLQAALKESTGILLEYTCRHLLTPPSWKNLYQVWLLLPRFSSETRSSLRKLCTANAKALLEQEGSPIPLHRALALAMTGLYSHAQKLARQLPCAKNREQILQLLDSEARAQQ